jgi:hypothetical protein
MFTILINNINIKINIKNDYNSVNSNHNSDNNSYDNNYHIIKNNNDNAIARTDKFSSVNTYLSVLR